MDKVSLTAVGLTLRAMGAQAERNGAGQCVDMQSVIRVESPTADSSLKSKDTGGLAFHSIPSTIRRACVGLGDGRRSLEEARIGPRGNCSVDRLSHVRELGSPTNSGRSMDPISSGGSFYIRVVGVTWCERSYDME